ncbi:MAG TPA: 2Fe-2S iron-sulfur cluster-binding protein [Candidatus Hydrogenedentes bacterium]|nr:2Fe-2S iron-sulfur cluster-binding protein [Candidatus Hydrogenedentota bacterium]
MAHLKINTTEIEAGEGATVLDAAQQAGVEIPTLCYLKQTGAMTSCMVCVVKDLTSGRMFPACSTKALNGMHIDTHGEAVCEARREILRLLLNEHVGDCEGPCSSICPAALNIPRMLRYIAAGDLDAAAHIAKRDLIFPATLGRLCTAPCEKTCRRGSYDTPITIRRLHGEISEKYLNNPALSIECLPKTDKTVAVIGSGIAGLSAAWMCLVAGHACRVYEKAAVACPALRTLPPEKLPPEILEAEIASVRDLGVDFVLNCEVGVDLPLEKVEQESDALIVACALHVSPSEKVFTAQEDTMLVRAVGHGKAAARRVDAFLRGLPQNAIPQPFNSQIGRLHAEEKDSYAVERLNKIDSTPESLHDEAVRCLHCDCLKPISCKLRQYAEEYGLGPRLKRTMARTPVNPIQCGGEVLFEPGKCIKCGICIEITRNAGEELGVTFEGRGIDSRVCVPFGEALARGLGKSALECVRACPTGALSLRNEEETQ